MGIEFYAGATKNESLIKATEPPALFAGALVPLDDSGRMFTLETDPRLPLESQTLLFHQPLGNGVLKLGAGFEGELKPVDYSIAYSADIAGGKADVSLLIRPLWEENRDRALSFMVGYRREF